MGGIDPAKLGLRPVGGGGEVPTDAVPKIDPMKLGLRPANTPAPAAPESEPQTSLVEDVGFAASRVGTALPHLAEFMLDVPQHLGAAAQFGVSGEMTGMSADRPDTAQNFDAFAAQKLGAPDFKAFPARGYDPAKLSETYKEFLDLAPNAELRKRLTQGRLPEAYKAPLIGTDIFGGQLGAAADTIKDVTGGTIDINKAFPEAKNKKQQLIEGVTEGIVTGGTSIPRSIVRAALPQVFKKVGRIEAETLRREVMTDILTGGVGGYTGTLAAQNAPEGWELPAGFVGGMAGGVGAVGTGKAVGATADKVGGYLRPAITTKGNVERMAGEALRNAATDPNRAIDEAAAATAPEGVDYTLGQATQDVGLLNLEQTLARGKDQKFREAMVQRARDQNAALANAVRGIEQGASPSAMSSFFHDRMGQLNERLDQLDANARKLAEQEAQGLETPDAGDVGGNLQDALAGEMDRVKQEVAALDKAVDPTGTMRLPTGRLRTAANELYAEMSPEERLSIAPEETALLNVINGYGGTIPYQRFRDLRTQLNEDMRNARSAGKGRAYGRMSQLRGALEADINDAVSGRFAREANAANEFVARARDWYERGAEAPARTGAAASPVGAAPGSAPAVPPRAGEPGAAGRELGAPAGDSGLSEDAAARAAVEGRRLGQEGRFDPAGEEFHGTRARGLSELRSSERGAFGPGVYMGREDVGRRYAGADGEVLPVEYRGNLFSLMPEWVYEHNQPEINKRIMSVVDNLPDGPGKQEFADWWKGGRGRNVADIYDRLTRGRNAYTKEQVSSAIRAAGYSGIEGIADGREVVVFNPGDTRIRGQRPSSQQALFQSEVPAEPKPAFYSAALKSVEDSKTNRASPQQWAATIKNTPGVKQEELDWLGLNSWLAQQKGAVTKEQVADYIRANQIEVEETMLAGEDVGRTVTADEIEIPSRWEDDEPDSEWVDQMAEEEKDIVRQEHLDEGIEPDDLDEESIEREARERAWKNAYEDAGTHTSVSVDTPDGGQHTYDLYRDSEGYTSIYDENGREVIAGERLNEGDMRREIGEFHDRMFPREEVEGAEGPTQFEHYTLPGGEDYRELLLRLPRRDGIGDHRPSPEVQAKYQNEWNILTREQSGLLGHDSRPTDRQRYAELTDQIDALHRKMIEESAEGRVPWRKGENFIYTPHFGDETNILAHVRFKDRTSVDGKRTLFLEEVQSDWHQQGRDRGYTPEPIPQEQRAALRKAAAEAEYARDQATAVIFNKYGDQIAAADSAERLRLIGERQQEYDAVLNGPLGKAADEAADAWHKAEGRNTVPDAPFKTTWPELALKRVIRWAADNGYDQIAWTPGSVQNARYGLSRHIDQIDWETGKATGNKRVWFSMPGRGSTGVSVDAEGKVISSDMGKEAVGKPLSELIGKDLASQIMADGGGRISKAGLAEIGGSGMREFYDRMLVSLGNKLGKKFNTQVGRTEIAVPRQGRDGDEIGIPRGQNLTAAALPITPEMRAGAQQGFPLFQKVNEAATSPLNDLPQPTEAQKEAGNYKKGRVRLGGLDLSIENPAGSTRSGKDSTGKPWSVDLKDHYGYIRGTVGKDKDHLDTFVSRDAGELGNDSPVFVVNQLDPKSGKFDEHKIMLGYPNRAAAEAAYKANYAKDWQGMGSIIPTTLGDLKRWIADGNTKRPFEQRSIPDAQGNVGTAGVRPVQGEAAPAAGNAGREADGSLRGLPRKVGSLTASAYPDAQRVAAAYMNSAGLEYSPPNTYAKVDPERATRIAAAYDEMQHNPADPEVQRAYQAMADETLAQYQAMLDDGMQIEFIAPGQADPYAGNPRNMTEDVRNNKHMWVFATRDGFGSDATFDVSDNPLLADSGYEISGQPAVINDIFRAVHDYFGHVKEGVGFRADGEENAWRAHSAMYSPEARRAMTSETRGQNSWVNYGPFGEANRTARSEDTHYADQKIGLLPEWVVQEGAGDDTIADTMAQRFARAGRPEPEAKAAGQIVEAFYATLANRLGVETDAVQKQFPLPRVERGGDARGLKQVPIDEAKRLNTPVKMPTDERFSAAVANTPGAKITDDGLVMDLTRYQPPEQGGSQAIRTGMFYLPSTSKNLRYYRASGTNYGGQERVQGETLIRNPLFVKGATGGAAPENAYAALKGKDALQVLKRDAARAASAQWMDKQEKGLFEHRIEKFLEEHGADPGMAWEIIRVSNKGNRLRYALQENVIAHALREAGHDAMVGWSTGKNGPFISEVFDVREDMAPTAFGDFSVREEFYQGPRGSILLGRDGAPALISLFETADATTALHESAHQFLDMFSRVADGQGAPEGLLRDWNATKAWWQKNAKQLATDAGEGITAADVRKVLAGESLGAKKDAAVARGMHEQWARAFEVYLRDGKAPNAAMKGLFEQFKDWLTQVYQSITGMGVELSPDIRGVFDRMLGAEGGDLIDQPAAKRLRDVTQRWKDYYGTYADKSAGPVPAIVRKSKGESYPFDMPPEAVTKATWKPGPDGATAIRNILKAAGQDRAAAVQGIEQSAMLSLNRTAFKNGVIEPAAFDKWKATHSDALAVMPDLAKRLDSAADATRAMQKVAKQAADARQAVERSAVGSILKLGADASDADISRKIGGMIGRQDAVKSMRELVNQARGEPEALAGLRRAVVDYALTQFTREENLSAAKLKSWMSRNRPALETVLDPEQMDILNAVVAASDRISNIVRSPGGGSPTTEYLMSLSKREKPSMIREMLNHVVGNAVQSGVAGGVGHALGGLGLGINTAVGAFLSRAGIDALRARGFAKVHDLMLEAILDPELGRTLMMKAPKEKGKGSARVLERTLASGLIGMIGGGREQARERAATGG